MTPTPPGFTHEVATSTGRVRGWSEGGVSTFHAIPYAAPPIGDRRWTAPEPHPPWDGVRDATRPGAVCPQPVVPRGLLRSILTPDQPHDEACLTLSVEVPEGVDGPLPTVVFVHGGGFDTGGASNVALAPLVRTGVLGVRVQHRLGPLGFLDLAGVPNVALQDLVAALRWVHAEIATFGGDSSNVTLVGHSAGAMAVTCLMAMPAAAGTFRRAVVLSGSAEVGLEPEEAAIVRTRFLDVMRSSGSDLAALRAAPVADLVDAGWRVTLESSALLPPELTARLAFQPTIDGEVLPRRPLDAIANGSSAGIDLLVGGCADEMRAFLFAAPPELRVVVSRVGLEGWFGTSAGVEAALAGYRLALGTDDDAVALAAIHSDGWFGLPTVRLVDAHRNHGAAYRYRLSWPTPVPPGDLGACHCLDLALLLDVHAPELVGSDPPSWIGSGLREAISRFATTGDPSGGQLGSWPLHEPGRNRVLDLGLAPRWSTDRTDARAVLWPESGPPGTT